MAINSHDQLLDCCSNPTSYPLNFLRPGNLTRNLKAHHEYLNAKDKRLFAPKRESLDVLELKDGENKYQSTRICNHKDLESHLQANHKDPRCRHIFLLANNSRKPLNCSREDFCYTFAFHQISPCFLHYVYSFGSTDDALDYSMTGFQWEDSLGAAEDELLEIPKLGRSGREIRVSYLLRSVERSGGGVNADPSSWTIRQMAVYHSFDLATGRAFWLNIKGNNLMRETIHEASEELPELRASSLEDLAGAFKGTLAIHLLLLEWCDGNWRHCINDTEEALKKIINKAKTADLDKDETGEIIDLYERAMTIQINESQAIGDDQAIPNKDTVLGSMRKGFGNMVAKLRVPQPTTSPLPPPNRADPAAVPQLGGNPKRRHQKESFKALEMFSFSELQELHHMGERLKEMRLVIQLDIQTLRDIRESYETLAERDELELEPEIKQKCKRQVIEFARKVDRITKNLEVRLTQLDTMISWLNDGKALFDNILQFRSVQASHIFSGIAHEQGKKMENIANKTEHQTGSMHVITFVTLAFLPATFVATFFQSGLVSWPNWDETEGAQVRIHFNGRGFKLFCIICVPMMVITGIIWFIIYKCLKNRRIQKRRAEVAAGLLSV